MSGLIQASEYAKLREHCDRLEEEIAALKAERRELADDEGRSLMAHRIKLSPYQAEIADLLLAAYPRAVSRFELAERTTLGSRRRPETDLKTIDVTILRLRTRCAEAGAPESTIATLWGRGWLITPQGRAWLMQMRSTDQRRAA